MGVYNPPKPEYIHPCQPRQIISWRPSGVLRWANVSKTENRLQQEWAAIDGPEREWRDVPTVLLYEPDV